MQAYERDTNDKPLGAAAHHSPFGAISEMEACSQRLYQFTTAKSSGKCLP